MKNHFVEKLNKDVVVFYSIYGIKNQIQMRMKGYGHGWKN